jgi:ABC-type transporter Mla subunit MlaD
MTFTVDDFVKIILTLSVCFSLVGISIQVIKMLGQLIETVKETNLVVRDGRDLLEKFVEDYDYFAGLLKSILESINGFTKGVFVPLTNLFGFLSKIDDLPFLKKRKEKSTK